MTDEGMTAETAETAETAVSGGAIDASIAPELQAEAPATKGFKSSRAPEPVPENGGDESGEPAAQKENVSDYLGVPDGDYSDDGIEVPAGLADDASLGHLATVCQELGLSQKGFATIVNRMAPYLDQRNRTIVREGMKAGLKTIYADPELGGANYKRTISACNKFLSAHVDTDTVQMLSETGLACHPGMIRMIYKLSQSISDDGFARGKSSPSRGLEAFFNNSQMNN